MKNIIFIAPPAAGKGTMSDLLIDKYGYVHISTGDILRDMASTNTDLGKNISNLLKEGKLIPDDIIYEAIEKRLSDKSLDNGYILDGFPRNLSQAIKYDEILNKINRNLGVVICLKTDEDILRRRITGRRICSKCGQTYNILTGVNMPKDINKCDKCGSDLYQRSDDNEDSFNVRYQTFLEKTYPLIEYYQKRNVLHEVDSNLPSDTMMKIEEIIND